MSEGMIRKLTMDDYEQSMELASYAFQYPLSQEQLIERKQTFLTDTETRYGYYVDHALRAQATVHHFNTYVSGKAIKMGGLAGVCTAPEYRRNGYVAQILQQALVDMKENGETISMLHPFRFGFYRKYGWESYIEYKSYEMQAEHLTSILSKMKKSPPIGSVERILDVERLLPIYDEYASRYNGTLKRSKEWWEKLINGRKKGNIAVYRSPQGHDEGYLLYQVLNSEFTIHELVATSYDSQKSIWNFIAQHDSMVDIVKWNAPIDDTFTYMLDNPRVKQTITPYFMARIVDVVSFIANYQFEPAGEDEAYSLYISDDFAPWNSGTFTLSINQQGRGQLTKVEEQQNFDLSIDIGALTSVMLNYTNFEANIRAERVQAQQYSLINRLQRRISTKTSYLTDFF